MSARTRLSLVLWVAGFSGAVSFLFIDFEALIALLPVVPGRDYPRVTPLLKALSLVQPAVFITLAVLAGHFLAPKTGLTAPAAEAWADGRPVLPALRPQWLPGLLGGLAGGAAIVLIAAVLTPLLPPGAADRVSAFGRVMPLAARLLYGGITEEVLLRWGLMSLLAWACWRAFLPQRERATAACFHAAIFLSAFIFGAAHLPVAFLLVPQPNLALIAFVIAANGVFGVVAGYLYWWRGLESAIVAHMTAHVVLFTASRLGAYF